MFYVEPIDSDSIELQNAMNESDVIDYASNFTDKVVAHMSEARKILQQNGYVIYQDC